MPGFAGTDKQKRRQFEAWVRENIGKFNCDMEEFYGVCLGDDIFEFYLIPRHDSEEERDNGIAGANRVAKDKYGNWRKKGSEFLPESWDSDYAPTADLPIAQKEQKQREEARRRAEVEAQRLTEKNRREAEAACRRESCGKSRTRCAVPGTNRG
jgi:hypothetical protein